MYACELGGSFAGGSPCLADTYTHKHNQQPSITLPKKSRYEERRFSMGKRKKLSDEKGHILLRQRVFSQKVVQPFDLCSEPFGSGKWIKTQLFSTFR